MGTPPGSYSASVVSWAGTHNTHLLDSLGEHSAVLTVAAGEGDRTAYGSGLTNMAYGPGLSTWECVITGRLLTGGSIARVGYAGNLAISGSDMYTAHLRAWSLTIEAISTRADEYQSAAVLAGWGQFIRGMMSASGSYDVLADASAQYKMPFGPGVSLPTATFTLTETANDTLACAVLPSALNANLGLPDLQTGQYSFRSSGSITVGAGCDMFQGYQGTTLGLPDFDYATPSNNALVLATVTGTRTLTGAAFWKNITINHSPADYVQVVITAQGYGAITPV